MPRAIFYVLLLMLIVNLRQVSVFADTIPVNYHYNSSFGNYYIQSSLMKEYKWNKFPVTVNLSRVPAKYKLTAIRAVNKWGQYIPLKISNSKDSNITIIWGYRLPTLGRGFVGQTDHIYINGIHKCIITVMNKRHYSLFENEEILVHELGHSLGLNHSHNSQDIMYNTIKPCKSAISDNKLITPRDLNTLYLIYSNNKVST